jgi:hypothetical protein
MKGEKGDKGDIGVPGAQGPEGTCDKEQVHSVYYDWGRARQMPSQVFILDQINFEPHFSVTFASL